MSSGKRKQKKRSSQRHPSGALPSPAPARGPASTLRVAPVTAQTWRDFEELFGARGSPHYCWCAPYRFRHGHEVGADERRRMMRELVHSSVPIGVLAYDGDAPVGWCSAAPRESYVKLERSRVMPRVTSAPTWTVLCFFVRRPYRRAGVSEVLLAGAIALAREHGAQVIEGYPYDSAGLTATHRGRARVFHALGFVQDGRRWHRDLTTAPD